MRVENRARFGKAFKCGGRSFRATKRSLFFSSLPFPTLRILAFSRARPPKVASKMAFNGFPFGGFTMGATGPDGMDVSLDDMIKQVRLSFSALATRKDN